MATDLTIEPVTDTGWVIAYRLGSPGLAVSADVAPFASPKLRQIWLDRLITYVDGTCPRCDTTTALPSGAKTAPGGECAPTEAADPHTPECPCALANICALETTESPFGEPYVVVLDEAAVAAIGAAGARVAPLVQVAASAAHPLNELEGL